MYGCTSFLACLSPQIKNSRLLTVIWAGAVAEALVSVLGSAHFPCTKVEDGEGAHAHGPGKIKAKVV